MSRTIVVSLDQSDTAERALPVAEVLAQRFDAKIQLISVFEVPPEYAEWAGRHQNDERWAKRYADMETYLNNVRLSLSPLNVSSQILTGSDPSIEVHESVVELDDAILVIASQGRSGISRLVLGSKAARFIQLATYPLVVVPADCVEYPDSMSRILLPLDGSSFAENALDSTLALFAGGGQAKPSIHLLRVVDQIYVESALDEELRVELVDEANAYLSGIADQLTDRGCDVSWQVEESFDVPNRIVTIAHEVEADLISLATHGRTGFSRFFLGSVADATLRSATKPVLVIRPSDDVVENAREPHTRRAGAS